MLKEEWWWWWWWWLAISSLQAGAFPFHRRLSTVSVNAFPLTPSADGHAEPLPALVADLTAFRRVLLFFLPSWTGFYRFLLGLIGFF